MNRKRIKFTADFKPKVGVELLEGDKTINEIASEHGVLPKSVQ